MESSTSRSFIRRLAAVSLVALVASIPATLSAKPADEFPDKGAEAMAYYEGRVDDFLQGPVQYIALKQEVEIFKDLTTRQDREAFIQWFWNRRDDDLRDLRNPYKIEFYQRVAEANRRYREFPRGWRSDRGEVHVMLGRPDAVSPTIGPGADSTIWTYFTVGPRGADRPFGASLGEITIAFVKTSQRAGYQIYGGFGGLGSLPLYVRDAFRFAREAAIVDPFLELNTAG